MEGTCAVDVPRTNRLEKIWEKMEGPVACFASEWESLYP
jgi:hypothetical protein